MSKLLEAWHAVRGCVDMARDRAEINIRHRALGGVALMIGHIGKFRHGEEFVRVGRQRFDAKRNRWMMREWWTLHLRRGESFVYLTADAGESGRTTHLCAWWGGFNPMLGYAKPRTVRLGKVVLGSISSGDNARGHDAYMARVGTEKAAWDAKLGKRVSPAVRLGLPPVPNGTADDGEGAA